MRLLANNFRTGKFTYSIFLMFFLYPSIAAFSVHSQTEEKKTPSTNNIDITVKDKNGYNHFLVFTKFMTPNKSYIAYTVE